MLILGLLTACGPFGIAAVNARLPLGKLVQESFPTPPTDRTLIYTGAGNAELRALPFETGTTPLRVDVAAGSDKVSRLDLKGERAATVITDSLPHFYLFVPDEASPHPPLLVRLSQRHGARRATVVAQRGQRGFAVASEEIVKPRYRVLGREGGMIFLEIWPREPLVAGEYAFVGSELSRIAAFSIK
jgi:hypothetical protein